MDEVLLYSLPAPQPDYIAAFAQLIKLTSLSTNLELGASAQATPRPRPLARVLRALPEPARRAVQGPAARVLVHNGRQARVPPPVWGGNG
ncbi:hypothetical protein H0H81_000552 [Sphagnurus paluster]|uniref:Uncharacterized protein n=1 Tax=Sphagnurus paluster TaxID=117069 RepID=A0A9P7FMV1_9AGAR|nr:hypothetical protein H0H81_000552 [Sphagnurus paluster]